MRHGTFLPAVLAPGELSLDPSRTAAPVGHARLVWLAHTSLLSSSPFCQGLGFRVPGPAHPRREVLLNMNA